MVTNAVKLASDVPAAATQAPGLPSLPSLRLAPLSTATIMLLNLPVPIVRGQNAQLALGHPLLIPPYHPFAFLLGL